MSSIYDNMKNAELLNGGLTVPSEVPQSPVSQPAICKEEDTLPTSNAEVITIQEPEESSLKEFNNELASYQERASHAMELVMMINST